MSEAIDQIIDVDSDFGKEIGFTSDRFRGYLWRRKTRIIVSVIMAIHPRQGHFTELVNNIESLGLKVAIANPLGAMTDYLAKRNFVPHWELDGNLEKLEIWERSPAFVGVNRQPKPKEVWRHFKGNKYQIIAASNSVWIPPDACHALIAKDSESEEFLAVYFHDYGITLARGDGSRAIASPHVIYSHSDTPTAWARELDNFLETLGDEGGYFYRFEKIIADVNKTCLNCIFGTDISEYDGLYYGNCQHWEDAICQQITRFYLDDGTPNESDLKAIANKCPAWEIFTNDD